MFIGSELLLVEFGELTNLSTVWLEVCPAFKDKIDIKCMGSTGGKTPIEPKLYLLSLTLGT
jgi:hypothetical protein